jgi:hypothetical protein
MARQRTGSSSEGGNDINAVDETDTSAVVDGVRSEPLELPKPVPAGHLRVFIHARRTGNPDPKSGGEFPPGEYDLPKSEAMHFVTTGAARIVAG